MRWQGCVALVGALVLCGLCGLCGTTRSDAESQGIDLKVIVNAENSDPIKDADLETYFLRKQRHWADGTQVVPLNFPPPNDYRRSFDHAVLRLTPDEVARYWLDVRIRSGETAPREIDDPALTTRLVTRLKGAICYVPGATDTRSVRVIARIHDGKLVAP